MLTLLVVGRLKLVALGTALLEPTTGGPPSWLAWLYGAFGTVEIATALPLAASPWSARAGVAGGLVGACTFAITSTLLLSLVTWELGTSVLPTVLDGLLVKDMVFAGVSLTVLGESLGRIAAERRTRREGAQRAP